jgi:hypothetical protein
MTSIVFSNFISIFLSDLSKDEHVNLSFEELSSRWEAHDKEMAKQLDVLSRHSLQTESVDHEPIETPGMDHSSSPSSEPLAEVKKPVKKPRAKKGPQTSPEEVPEDNKPVKKPRAKKGPPKSPEEVPDEDGHQGEPSSEPLVEVNKPVKKPRAKKGVTKTEAVAVSIADEEAVAVVGEEEATEVAAAVVGEEEEVKKPSTKKGGSRDAKKKSPATDENIEPRLFVTHTDDDYNKILTKHGIKCFKNDASKCCTYMYSSGQFQGTLCDRAVTAKSKTQKCPIHSKQPDEECELLKLERHPILKVFYHPDSKLVFASDKEKIVKGTIVNDGALAATPGIQLEFDQELCSNYGFLAEMPQGVSEMMAYTLTNLPDGPLYSLVSLSEQSLGQQHEIIVGSDQPI